MENPIKNQMCSKCVLMCSNVFYTPEIYIERVCVLYQTRKNSMNAYVFCGKRDRPRVCSDLPNRTRSCSVTE